MIDTTWCDILSERIDTPIINYGRAGVSNLQLIEMAEDICKNKNPKMIIAEMRWTSHPLLLEKHKYKEEYSQDLFSRTRHNMGEDSVDDVVDKYSEIYYSIHYGFSKHINEDHNLERWKNKFSETKYFSDKTIDDIRGWIRICFLHNIMADQYRRQSLSNMYHLQSICDRYNVPLKLFVWTASNYADVSESNFDMTGLSTFDFFKDGKTFIEHAGDWTSKHRCECEHFQTPVHEYFVDTILEEVRQCLS